MRTVARGLRPARTAMASALVWAALAVAPAARADSAVVVHLNTDLALSPAERGEVLATVASALEAHGIDARGAEGLPAGARCPERECLVAARQAARADWAVVVALWEGSGEDPRTLAIGLVGGDGVEYGGSAAVGGGDLAAAAREAVRQARARARLGPGPWLFIDGEPEGASVRVDGELVGQLPWRIWVKPGLHSVEVSAPGRQTWAQEVRIPDDAGATTRLTARLAALGDPGRQVGGAASREGRSGAPEERGRGVWGVMGPVLLGAAGLAALGYDAVVLARAGCDQRAEDGTCLVGRRLRTVPFALYGVGGVAAVAGAVLWLVLGGGDGEAGPTVGVGPRGVGMVASF